MSVNFEAMVECAFMDISSNKDKRLNARPAEASQGCLRICVRGTC